MKKNLLVCLVLTTALGISACSGAADEPTETEIVAVDLLEETTLAGELPKTETSAAAPESTAQESTTSAATEESTLAGELPKAKTSSSAVQHTNKESEESSAIETTANDDEQKVKTKIGASGEPDEIELMSYAQTVLEDFYPDLKVSRDKSTYVFARTDMRYKIKGYFFQTKDDKEQSLFEMIIRFTDDSFTSYDLLDLFVDGHSVYESSSKNDLYLDEDQKQSDNILTDENLKIYNNVMEKLYSEPDRSEDDIFAELAPQYGMTKDELRDFMNNFMEAYYYQ